MENKSYLKGRRFEYKIRNHFKERGYFVIRQAKSSFPDIIAIQGHKIPYVIAIECKVNGYLTKEEKRRFSALPGSIKKFLAYKKKTKVCFKEIK